MSNDPEISRAFLVGVDAVPFEPFDGSEDAQGWSTKAL